MRAVPHTNLSNVGVTTTSTLQIPKLGVLILLFIVISQSSAYG